MEDILQISLGIEIAHGLIIIVIEIYSCSSVSDI